MPYFRRSPQIFVSYRRLPSAMLATLLATQMEERGIRAFVDTRQTDGGGPFPDRLLRAIEAADVFVCLLAETTLNSEWVRREIQHANEQHKVMIPIFQENYARPDPPPDAHIAALLESDGIHVFDQQNLYIDQAMDQLATMVRTSTKARPISLGVVLATALLVLILISGLVIVLLSQNTPNEALSTETISTETLRPIAQLNTVEAEMTATALTATAAQEDVLAQETLDAYRSTRVLVNATLTQAVMTANAALTAQAQITATPPETLPAANLASQFPDLSISRPRILPAHPAPGQVAVIAFTVTNAGGANSGDFNWAFFHDALNAGAPDVSGAIDNIPAGASRAISFPYTFTNWGSYDTTILVDSNRSVPDSDVFNNVRAFPIVLADEPLTIDFSLLPDNQIVASPLILRGDEFLPYNLSFGLDTSAHPECQDTPLNIVDMNDNPALTVVEGTPESCAQLPLVIDALQPFGNMVLDVIPSVSGTATLTFYSDREGTKSIFETTVNVQAGQSVHLTNETIDPAQRILRAELSMSGQSVVLDTVTLFSVTWAQAFSQS